MKVSEFFSSLFSRAAKAFIFVITSGLQPARDLLFRLFQQPVQPGAFPTSESVSQPLSSLRDPIRFDTEVPQWLKPS